MLSKKISRGGGYFKMMTTLKFFSPGDVAKRFPLGNFKNFNEVILEIEFQEDFIKKIEGFREGKKDRRIEKYLTPEEIKRFVKRIKEKDSTVVRFGGKKEKPKGDFCLSGGVFKAGKFYVLYRSLEVSFEIFFDLWMFHWLCKKANVKLKKVIIFTPRMFMSSREGRMNYARKLRSLLE